LPSVPSLHRQSNEFLHLPEWHYRNLTKLIFNRIIIFDRLQIPAVRQVETWHKKGGTMIGTTARFIVSGAVLLLFVGCSVDMGEILEHPQQINPSKEFEVALVNQYALFLNSSTAAQAISRDSMHLAVGFPNGYSVVSAKCYYANGLNVLKMASAMDTAAAEKAMADSAVIYKSRATAMQGTPQFVALLKNRSYQAKDENGDSMEVNTDAIKNWSAWGGRINLAIPAGTPADTSLITEGMAVSVISKSVFIWVTLKAKSTAGQDTLYYYTKTAALIDTATIDAGSIVYAPLKVTTAGTKPAYPSKQETAALSVWTTGGENVVVNFKAVYREALALEVFNISGMRVADLSAMLPGSNGTVTWSARRGAVKPGMYILRLKTRNGVVSTPLKVM
jgi:hypothetical protein